MTKQYRDDFNEVKKEYFWTLPRVIGMAVGGLVLLGIAGTAMTVLSTPSRVLNKTLETDNVILRYEYFHDADANIRSKVSQVHQFKRLFADPTVDTSEKNRLRIEVAAIQQSCRDLTNKYNANANKMNVGIFRGWSLPSQQNPGDCE